MPRPRWSRETQQLCRRLRVGSKKAVGRTDLDEMRDLDKIARLIPPPPSEIRNMVTPGGRKQDLLYPCSKCKKVTVTQNIWEAPSMCDSCRAKSSQDKVDENLNNISATEGSRVSPFTESDEESNEDFCERCWNHGLRVLVLHHRRRCKFKDCECVKCMDMLELAKLETPSTPRHSGAFFKSNNVNVFSSSSDDSADDTVCSDTSDSSLSPNSDIVDSSHSLKKSLVRSGNAVCFPVNPPSTLRNPSPPVSKKCHIPFLEKPEQLNLFKPAAGSRSCSQKSNSPSSQKGRSNSRKRERYARRERRSWSRSSSVDSLRTSHKSSRLSHSRSRSRSLSKSRRSQEPKRNLRWSPERSRTGHVERGSRDTTSFSRDRSRSLSQGRSSSFSRGRSRSFSRGRSRSLSRGRRSRSLSRGRRSRSLSRGRRSRSLSRGRRSRSLSRGRRSRSLSRGRRSRSFSRGRSRSFSRGRSTSFSRGRRSSSPSGSLSRSFCKGRRRTLSRSRSRDSSRGRSTQSGGSRHYMRLHRSRSRDRTGCRPLSRRFRRSASPKEPVSCRRSDNKGRKRRMSSEASHSPIPVKKMQTVTGASAEKSLPCVKLSFSPPRTSVSPTAEDRQDDFTSSASPKSLRYCNLCLNHGLRNLCDFHHRSLCNYRYCCCAGCLATILSIRGNTKRVSEFLKNSEVIADAIIAFNEGKHLDRPGCCMFCRNHKYTVSFTANHMLMCYYRKWCCCERCLSTVIQLRYSIDKRTQKPTSKPGKGSLEPKPQKLFSEPEDLQSKPTSDIRFCLYCKNHGVVVEITKSHKLYCQRRSCACSKCSRMRSAYSFDYRSDEFRLKKQNKGSSRKSLLEGEDAASSCKPVNDVKKIYPDRKDQNATSATESQKQDVKPFSASKNTCGERKERDITPKKDNICSYLNKGVKEEGQFLKHESSNRDENTKKSEETVLKSCKGLLEKQNSPSKNVHNFHLSQGNEGMESEKQCASHSTEALQSTEDVFTEVDMDIVDSESSPESFPLAESPTTDSFPLAKSPTTDSFPLAKSPTTDSFPLAKSPTTDSFPLAESPKIGGFPLAKSPSRDRFPLAKIPTRDIFLRDKSPFATAAASFDKDSVVSKAIEDIMSCNTFKPGRCYSSAVASLLSEETCKELGIKIIPEKAERRSSSPSAEASETKPNLSSILEKFCAERLKTEHKNFMEDLDILPKESNPAPVNVFTEQTFSPSQDRKFSNKPAVESKPALKNECERTLDLATESRIANSSNLPPLERESINKDISPCATGSGDDSTLTEEEESVPAISAFINNTEGTRFQRRKHSTETKDDCPELDYMTLVEVLGEFDEEVSSVLEGAGMNDDGVHLEETTELNHPDEASPKPEAKKNKGKPGRVKKRRSSLEVRRVTSKPRRASLQEDCMFPPRTSVSPRLTSSAGRRGRHSPPSAGRTCALCRNHGVEVDLKGHRKTCPFQNCTCDACHVTVVKRRRAADLTGFYRQLQRDQEDDTYASAVDPRDEDLDLQSEPDLLVSDPEAGVEPREMLSENDYVPLKDEGYSPRLCERCGNHGITTIVINDSRHKENCKHRLCDCSRCNPLEVTLAGLEELRERRRSQGRLGANDRKEMRRLRRRVRNAYVDIRRNLDGHPGSTDKELAEDLANSGKGPAAELALESAADTRHEPAREPPAEHLAESVTASPVEPETLVEPPAELLEAVIDPPLDPETLVEPLVEVLEPVTDPPEPETLVEPLVEVLEPATDPPEPETLVEPLVEVLEPATDPPEPETLVEPLVEVLEPATDPPEPETLVEPLVEVLEPVTDPHVDPEIRVEPLSRSAVQQLAECLSEPISDVNDKDGRNPETPAQSTEDSPKLCSNIVSGIVSLGELEEERLTVQDGDREQALNKSGSPSEHIHLDSDIVQSPGVLCNINIGDQVDANDAAVTVMDSVSLCPLPEIHVEDHQVDKNEDPILDALLPSSDHTEESNEVSSPGPNSCSPTLSCLGQNDRDPADKEDYPFPAQPTESSIPVHSASTEANRIAPFIGDTFNSAATSRTVSLLPASINSTVPRPASTDGTVPQLSSTDANPASLNVAEECDDAGLAQIVPGDANHKVLDDVLDKEVIPESPEADLKSRAVPFIVIESEDESDDEDRLFIASDVESHGGDETTDAPEVPVAVPADAQGSAHGTRMIRKMFCKPCKLHGLTVPLKGHKGLCMFRKCLCYLCNKPRTKSNNRRRSHSGSGEPTPQTVPAAAEQMQISYHRASTAEQIPFQNAPAAEQTPCQRAPPAEHIPFHVATPAEQIAFYIAPPSEQIPFRIEPPAEHIPFHREPLAEQIPFRIEPPVERIPFHREPLAEQIPFRIEPPVERIPFHREPLAEQIPFRIEPPVERIPFHREPPAEQIPFRIEPPAERMAFHREPPAEQIPYHRAVTAEGGGGMDSGPVHNDDTVDLALNDWADRFLSELAGGSRSANQDESSESLSHLQNMLEAVNNLSNLVGNNYIMSSPWEDPDESRAAVGGVAPVSAEPYDLSMPAGTKTQRENVAVSLGPSTPSLVPDVTMELPWDVSAESQFKCDDCSLSLTSRQHLAEHRLMNHAGVVSFSCEMCPNVSWSLLQHDIHMAVAHDPPFHRCAYCQVCYPTYSLLRAHQFTQHPEMPLQPYTCPLCPNLCRSPSELSVHLRVVHRGDRPFRCELCGARYDSPAGMISHFHRKHFCGAGLGASMELRCVICAYAFPFPELLALHHNTAHTERLPFACPCGKRFNSTNAMQVHVRKVHTEEMFQCVDCPRRFQSLRALAVHACECRHMLAITSGPFSCRGCPSSYRDRFALSDHENAVHMGLVPMGRLSHLVSLVNELHALAPTTGLSHISPAAFHS